ncbi:MAG: saccharopine dehydrogenase NADP-binding domain-containing protein [Candidatus Saccharicenans sp.]|jgi:saccharopine dehydrogenase-like NADP-dependent oxidoreductase|nr:saccharopine dehydrogenase NADP-binding domain-containing protein [Candidatus Saccharicenans sp.]MDH7493667.1 saccharopine dehydrogenase C-terminal domain-containing protein [Candidatus Saccharicenans sp.]
MKIIVLGAGLVGRAMALDLATEKDFRVTAADQDKTRLEELAAGGLATIKTDLSRPENLAEVIRDQELVLNALPGWLGFKTLRTSLESGKNVVDIAFFPEDPFELDGLAREKGLAAIVDAGVAPGLSHLLAAYGLSQLDRGQSLHIYVGGLPLVRQWPFEYKAVFSPLDVIEEYLRPARMKENGQLVTRPALSDPEFLEFEELGTLEAFNTDGLRTLLRTLDLPEMKEKTLRYPGHREKMLMLREAGFFDSSPVDIGGLPIKPLEFTAGILFSRLQLKPGDEDLTVLRVMVAGERDGRPTRFSFELLDRFDRVQGIHSMARTTGYTATMLARALARNLVKQKGIIAPERLGFEPEIFSFVRKGLEARGITIKEKVETS